MRSEAQMGQGLKFKFILQDHCIVPTASYRGKWVRHRPIGVYQLHKHTFMKLKIILLVGKLLVLREKGHVMAGTMICWFAFISLIRAISSMILRKWPTLWADGNKL